MLVILGLLVGGILAGQSLIRASELRSLSADVTKYTTATFAFKDKYFALPGDMANATAFWGVAGGTTGDPTDTACQQTASTDARTCNGDGNGQVVSYERLRYWQHLANAGLVEGTYTGRGWSYLSNPQYGCQIGRNCPAMRLGKASISPLSAGLMADDGNVLPYTLGTYFFVGKTSLTNGGINDNPLGAILATEEMWNIDTKLDDGLPNSGTVRVHFKKASGAAWAQDVNNCSSANLTDSPYDLARPGLSCAIRYQMMK